MDDRERPDDLVLEDAPLFVVLASFADFAEVGPQRVYMSKFARL